MPRFAYVLAFLLILAGPAAAAPPQWRVDMDASRLGFTTYWQNAPVKGVFETWRADIRFDPDDLAASRVAVEIETGSVDTAYADRDAEIVKPDWFAVAAFPTATFTAERFRQEDGPAYVAEGQLTIKGVTQDLALPFDLVIEGGTARMTANVPVSRLVFNVGEGQWQATNFIKEEVIVEIEVTATREE